MASENIPARSFKAAIEEFSEKPIKIYLPNQTFHVPANYLTMVGRERVEEEKLERFRFVMFLPELRGYKRGDPIGSAVDTGRLREYIDIYQVREIATSQQLYGSTRPSAWGEPDASFEVLKGSREFVKEMYGLECYAFPNPQEIYYNFLCKGTRSNGEGIVITTQEEEGNPLYYFCEVNISSEQAQLHVRYRFSRHYLERWRDIDEAVWNNLHAWRVK